MESAMGTAIEVFEGSEAILVPRTRFRPVKTTNDLLVIRSDFFSLDDDYHVVAAVDGPEPFVDLDSAYRFVSGFEKRFPKGVPSMRDCTSLRVIGDPVFGRNVRCIGDVLIDGYRRVLDDAVLGELPGPATAPASTSGDLRTVDEHLKAILVDARAVADRVDAAHRGPRPRRGAGRPLEDRPPGLRQLVDGRVCRPRPSRSPAPARRRCGCASSARSRPGTTRASRSGRARPPGS